MEDECVDFLDARTHLAWENDFVVRQSLCCAAGLVEQGDRFDAFGARGF